MDAIDLILNIAALLLWLNWRSTTFTSHPASALSLLSTLRRAEPRVSIKWIYPIAVLVLLLVRSLLYWQIGPGVNWTPALDLVAIVLPFRSDRFLFMLLFSFLSFIIVLIAFYSWLLLLSVVNRRVADSDPVQKLARLYLGAIDRLPATAKLVLPPLGALLFWLAGSAVLAQFGLVPAPRSAAHLWQQAFVLAAASLLFWKPLLIAVFLLYVVNSYVYLGRSAFLEFVNTTARNVLRVFEPLRLRVGKLDFSPLLGLAIVILISKMMALWLPVLYRMLPL